MIICRDHPAHPHTQVLASCDKCDAMKVFPAPVTNGDLRWLRDFAAEHDCVRRGAS